VLGFIGKVVERLQTEGAWDTLRYAKHWACERYFERRLGIASSGAIDRRKLGIDHPDPAWCNYEPIDYRSLRRALAHLDIRPDRDVFIDYGSGKGRAVIMAATYPFQRVIGVEISAQLDGVARDNVRRAMRRLKCRNIELIQTDASTYELPTDVDVVLLYNPFGGDVLAAVVRNIRASLLQRPRDMTVIYKYPAGLDDPFSRCAWLRLREAIECYSHTGEKLLIYQTTSTHS
jgi:hypothetical protein